METYETFSIINKRSLRATRPLMKTRDSLTPFGMTIQNEDDILHCSTNCGRGCEFALPVNGRESCRPGAALSRQNQRPPAKSGGLCFCAMSRGRRDYRLGLGVVLCAELGVSVPRTFVIRRTSTRRFLARPSAVVLGAAYLSLPIPIR